jgi:AAA domain
VPEYVYRKPNGDPAYRVVKDRNKNFFHQHEEAPGKWVSGRGDAEPIPYNLPEVLAAIEAGDEPIWIMEGEKDADNAIAMGLVATTNSGGADQWRSSHTSWLEACEEVYICWDKDDPGRKRALSIEHQLRAIGVPDIHFRSALVGNDFTDHINATNDINKLRKVRPKAPDPEPEENGKGTDGKGSKHQPAVLQILLERLDKVTQEGGKPNQWNALCPAHDDKNPSLSIRLGAEKDGDSVALLVKCQANKCKMEDIANAVGIDPSEFTQIRSVKGTQEYANEEALMRMRASQFAKRILMQDASSNRIEFGDNSATGKDELAIPLEPVKFLIDTWFRYSSSVLLNAQPKAGKTRLCLNLMQSLTDGKPFLGKYATEWPEGARVWYGNWDMSEELFRTYLHEYQWAVPDAWIISHLGGGEFPFWVPEVFDDFVQYALRMQIHLMIVDTLHVAGQGFITDENNNTEVSQFVSLLKAMCKAAHIPHLLVVHHTAKNSQDGSGRGASTLMADFDGLWTLTMENGEEHDSPRSLAGRGRKLGVSPLDLVYDMATETYSYDGTAPTSSSGSFKVDKFETYCVRLVEYYTAEGHWPRSSYVRKNFCVGENSVRSEFMAEAVGLGYVEHKQMKGRSFEVMVTDEWLEKLSSENEG